MEAAGDEDGGEFGIVGGELGERRLVRGEGVWGFDLGVGDLGQWVRGGVDLARASAAQFLPQGWREDDGGVGARVGDGVLAASGASTFLFQWGRDRLRLGHAESVPYLSSVLIPGATSMGGGVAIGAQLFGWAFSLAVEVMAMGEALPAATWADAPG